MERKSKVSGTPSWKPIELRGEGNINDEQETLLFGNAGINFDNVGVSFDDGGLVEKVRDAVRAKYESSSGSSTTEDSVIEEEERLAKELLDINEGRKPIKKAKQIGGGSRKIKASNVGGEKMNIDNALEKLASLLVDKITSMLKTGQQAELGERAEKEIESEKNLEAGKKDLGEVKLPGVKVQETSKTAQQAELGERAEKEIENEKNLEAGKKDLGEVKLPSVSPSVTSSPVEPVKQKDVKMPSGEPQKEITTSKEEAEEAKRGVSAGLKKVYEKTRYRRLYATPAEEKGAWYLVDEDGNVYMKGTPDEIVKHIDEMIEKGEYTTRKRSAQQVELGERAEKEIENEKNLEAGKKDLGEVKLPGVKVVEKGSLTAKFIPQEDKVDSYWKVLLNHKPVFAVSFRDAFGDIKEVDTDIKTYLSDFNYFCSEDYGRDLLGEVSRIGIKNTIDKWFRDDRGNIRVSIYKSSQVSGETTEGASEEPDETPKMSLDERVTERLIPEEGTKGKEETPILELLANVLASVIVSSKDLSEDEVVHQLKSIFSDDKLVERFTGILKEKVSAISEKVKSEGSEEGMKEITSMFRASQFADKLVDYFKKMKSKDTEVDAKISEYMSKLRDMEREKEELKAKIARLENELYLRDKAKRVAEVVKKMIKKGLLKESEAQKKIEELMRKSDAAIEDFSDLIDKIEGNRATLGRLNNVIPVTTSGKQSEEEDLFAGLFTKPPVVNEDERKLRVSGKKIEK